MSNLHDNSELARPSPGVGGRFRALPRLAVFAILLGSACLLTSDVFAQRRSRQRPASVAPIASQWKVDPAFKHDVFTFARVRYESASRWGGSDRNNPYYGDGGPRWSTDAPDAELNLSFRLQQMTSIKVNPEPVTVDLTQPDLYNYPFLYMVEPGGIRLAEDEAIALRKYLLNGGFLLVDDFWGEDAWDVFHQAMKQVFPDREPVELPLEHPVFHCVFDLKEKPQVPGMRSAKWVHSLGLTTERPNDPSTHEVHYKAISDDKGRIMVMICHNTDLGDGWEREGEDEWYFREFGEKRAFPMGINIIFYAMTH